MSPTPATIPSTTFRSTTSRSAAPPRRAVFPVALALLVVTLLARPSLRAEPPPATVIDFTVSRPDESLQVRLLDPPAEVRAANPWVLLTFSTDRQTSLTAEPYCGPGYQFLRAGHRVASFDLPAHGDRVDARGRGIDGLRERFLAGADPFVLFCGDGSAVIDELLRREWAVADRIAVVGVSRAGYCALRLLAADRRIAGGAGLAPVTDWRVLSEFATCRDRADVAQLALDHFAKPLAGRPLYLAMGNRDQRVGTDALLRFGMHLAQAEEVAQLEFARFKLVIADDSPRHTLHDRWRDAGGEFLLQLTR